MKTLRRRHERISIRKAVHIARHEQGPEFLGHTVNVSESGLFVEASELFPVGTVLAMRLPVSDRNLRFKGRVVRTDPNQPVSGMGIEFVDLPKQMLEALRSVVSSASTENGERKSVKIWWEGHEHPVRSHADFCADGIQVSSKLPFLRHNSVVSFQLEGDDTVRQGLLDTVGLSIDKNEGIPRLTILLRHTDSPYSERMQTDGDLSEQSVPRITYKAGSFEAKDSSLEEALAGLALVHNRRFDLLAQTAREVERKKKKSRHPKPSDSPPTGGDEEEFDALLQAVDEALGPEPSAQVDGAIVRTTLSVPKEKNTNEVSQQTSRGLTTRVEYESETEQVSIETTEAEIVSAVTSGARIGGTISLRELEGATLSAEALAALDNNPGLRFLNLRGTGVSDEGLASIAKLRRLRHLDLSGTEITDEGIKHLVAADEQRDADSDVLALPAAGKVSTTSRETQSDAVERGHRRSFSGIAFAFFICAGLSFAGGHYFNRLTAVPETIPPATRVADASPRTSPSLENVIDQSHSNETSGPGSTRDRASSAETTEEQVSIIAQRAEVLRVVTEGVGQVLVVPMSGSLEPISEYRLVRPFGVAIDLPNADPLIALGQYMPNDSGFRRAIISRGIAGSEAGTHIRVHFAKREPHYRVEVDQASVRIILPR